MPYNYFDDTWRTKIFHCRKCGWSGTYDQAQISHHQDFMDVLCPRCDLWGLGPTLGLVMHPTLGEMRANIDKPGVREQLRLIDSFREAE